MDVYKAKHDVCMCTAKIHKATQERAALKLLLEQKDRELDDLRAEQSMALDRQKGSRLKLCEERQKRKETICSEESRKRIKIEDANIVELAKSLEIKNLNMDPPAKNPSVSRKQVE